MSLLLPLLFMMSPPPALESGRQRLAQAETWIARESYNPALRALTEASAIAERDSDRALAARVEQMTANALIGRGDVEEAKSHHERALAGARSLGDRSLEAAVEADMGLGHYAHAEYKDAEEHLRRSLALRSAENDRAGAAASRDRLGRVLFKQGRYDEALAVYEGALAVQTQIGDRKGQAETLYDIAMLHLDKHSYNEALGAASRSLAVYEAIGSPEGRVRVLCSSAAMYLFQDAPDAALERLEKAMAVADAVDDRSLRAKVQYHLGGVHLDAGRHHEAIEAYEKAFVVMEQDGNLREAAWTLARRGRALEALDRFVEAEASYERAIALWEKIRERRPRAWYLYVTGRLSERRGDDEAALRRYRSALEEQESVHLPYASEVLSHMALLLQRRGETVEALALARRAVEVAGGTGNPEMRWSAHHAQGRLLRRLDRNEEALAAFEECLSVIEAMRHDVAPSDEARTGFMETKQDAYADTVSVLFELGRVEEALEIAERARARAFLDLLSTRTEAPSRMRSATTPPIPASLSDIRAEASRRRVTLIEYFAGETDLFTWVASPAGPIHGVRTPVGRAELAAIVEKLEAALQRGPFVGASRGSEDLAAGGDGDSLDALLRRLHAELMAPVERWLPTDAAAEITIIPHGPLFRVSFGGLIDARGRYVAETHTLNYAPAVGVLHYTAARQRRASRSGAGRLLAIGGPAAAEGGKSAPALPDLPAAAEEARGVASFWPEGRSTVLLGEGAKESSLREAARRYAYLHLASHGVVLDASPLKSYVALTRGDALRSDDDGELTVAEVLDLDLDADLVTLSACDTGRGRITGDGVLGLSRAFVYAGASSVVVSLWRVADVVGRFQMERFYRALATGEDKATALRRAQLDTLAALRKGEIRTPEGRPLRDTPALWAPFVLIGEPR